MAQGRRPLGDARRGRNPRRDDPRVHARASFRDAEQHIGPVLCAGYRFDPNNFNRAAVRLLLAPAETKGAPRHRGAGFVQEAGAAMGYAQGLDGRVLCWSQGFALEGLPPPTLGEVIREPAEITREVVERDVIEFLRAALATSYRAPAPSVERLDAPVALGE